MGGVDSGKFKILLMDTVVMDSKIDRETVTMMQTDPSGQNHEIRKEVPSKVLAIRFKKIIKTVSFTGPSGEEDERYYFQKKQDGNGNLTEQDAEFYAFTGSKVMIDQALNDFGPEDLPAPTVIMQEKGKDGKTYTKFT